MNKFISVLLAACCYSTAFGNALLQQPEKVIAQFSDCAKSDQIVQRLAQEIGDWLDIRRTSPEALLNGWFRAFEQVASDFAGKSDEQVLRLVDQSLVLIDKLANQPLEDAIIRMIDHSVGQSCPTLSHKLLQLSVDRILNARAYQQDLQQLKNIILNIQKSTQYKHVLDQQAKAIKQQCKELNLCPDW